MRGARQHVIDPMSFMDMAHMLNRKPPTPPPMQADHSTRSRRRNNMSQALRRILWPSPLEAAVPLESIRAVWLRAESAVRSRRASHTRHCLVRFHVYCKYCLVVSRSCCPVARYRCYQWHTTVKVKAAWSAWLHTRAESPARCLSIRHPVSSSSVEVRQRPPSHLGHDRSTSCSGSA